MLPPPAKPFETPSGDGWLTVEARLGIELPEDYKEFITHYGTGAVDGFLWVLNPFSANKYLNFFDAGKAQLRALHELQHEIIPYPKFPDADGILPWSVTDNGDVLYWLCKGPSANRLIVVNESRGPRWREFRLSTSEFLARIVTGKLVVDVFPEDFPSASPTFVPVDSVKPIC